jgi:hypothetical protein
MIHENEPTEINEFNGLWDKGDPDNTPIDHFSDCENVKYIGVNSFGTRDGIDKHQNVAVPLGNIVRLYNYVTQDKNTLLVLTYDGTDGKIYHVVDSTTVFGPILTIAGMEDFAFVPVAGRAYITPFKTFTAGGINIEKGIQSQFLYVYLGTGSAARKAAGTPPSGAITIANGAAGNTDAGFHLFGVVFETDTGYLTPPAAFNTFVTNANLSVSFTTVPVSGQSFVTKRHIVATKVIASYNGNTTGYQYFFIPGATIPDNVGTSLPNISFFDADLLEDASHLLDNFSEIPAGAALSVYHNRLCLSTTFTDISLVYVSEIGEPEAINQIEGILVVPPDGNPITNHQELRDVFYVMKRNRTVSYVDNEDIPSTWPLTVVDQGNGCPVHGIATVIDSGSSSVDFLIIASLKGIIIFNGRYALPELSWKISDFWLRQSKSNARFIQVLNDSVNQILYCSLPDRRLLVGNYANGLDPKGIRWVPWKFDVKVNTVALVNINDLIIGAESRLV